MTTVEQARRRSALLSYFSLFTSVGTLFCCALPSLFVLLGMGATVASVLSSLPWLVTLSHHKNWTFGVSATLIAFGFANVYYLGPRLRADACAADDPSACETATRFSKVVLWTSAALCAAGAFVAFALGPILAWMDKG
jgi:mercuric ion transport protein